MLLYCSGAFLESLGEPLYNLYNHCFRVDCRLKADAAAITLRSIVTFAAVIYYDLGVVGFGLAQLSYGLVHVLVMLWSYKHVVFTAPGELKDQRITLIDLLPRGVTGGNPSKEGGAVGVLFGSKATGPAMHMTCTSLLKHALTEADKIALSLSTVATHYDQGVYGVIHNYGSLVARMVFQPIEETSRITFSKMAAEARVADDEGDAQAVEGQVSAMSTLVSLVLKGVGLFSIMFPVFGPFYARLAVQIGLGARWYSEETVWTLGVYCLYILAMALNGVTEAFVYATASPGLLGTVNVSLIISSLAFCLSCAVLIEKMGTSGILVANIIGMSIRIGFNLRYTERYFANPDKYFLCLGEKRASVASAVVVVGVAQEEVEEEVEGARSRSGGAGGDSDAAESRRMTGSPPPPPRPPPRPQRLLTPLKDACVYPLDLVGLGAVSAVLYHSCARFALSGRAMRDVLQHVAVGATGFAMVLGGLYWSHGEDFRRLVGTMRAGAGPAPTARVPAVGSVVSVRGRGRKQEGSAEECGLKME